jgi:hypothetical protein
MMGERKQLQAQIAAMDQKIHQEQALAMAHRRYFAQGSVDYSLFLVIGLLIPCIWLGWKVSSKQWVSKIMVGLVELVAVTSSAFVRRMLMNYLNKFLQSNKK